MLWCWWYSIAFGALLIVPQYSHFTKSCPSFIYKGELQLGHVAVTKLFAIVLLLYVRLLPNCIITHLYSNDNICSQKLPLFRVQYLLILYREGVFMLLDASLVGRVIQDYRESKGLSQEVVSGLADIGRTHLSAIECGARKPTMETFFRISEALGIRPSELMRMIEDAMD